MYSSCSLKGFFHDHQNHRKGGGDVDMGGFDTKYRNQSSQSSDADDGSEYPIWGDDSHSDWLPTRSGDGRQKKSAKHLSVKSRENKCRNKIQTV
ncbi:predicted protein [Sclerotinia sclerotiorum 1980 UF-70]|uniref:Uncharacterized protein n=1 Tax=Sclerotinia sclerotiorum (strain ATCC 18683 / 1980 / Ss-1) TaxID=665079 RepID=A7EVT2_SCLS1|nr:predicted protein [Sclerotinia sclerotiorum 1980 UF-70]EDN93574.1 predicted protein [Sclerotinia sclerotiorum 1980 UF-70]